MVCTLVLAVAVNLIFCDLRVQTSETVEDPYKILGVPKKASIKVIKRAYKALAKEWHPDKNMDADAHEKFMAITRAYEVLSDPAKKERFDKYGTFDEPTQERRHTFHPFDDLFGFGFHGFDTGNSFFRKHHISIRMFSHTILERSNVQPFIIFAYSGYCQLCFRVEPVWQSVVEDLEPLGYGIGTVNAMIDGNLLEKLRVSRLPSVVVVVEGRVLHYRGTMQPLNAKSLRVFARDVIPKTFLSKIFNHDGLKHFIDQWQYYNKISVIVFGSKEEPRLRYLLAAMKYAPFARFAYVYLSDQSTEIVKMRQALEITCFNCENIIIFNDLPQDGPVTHLSIGNGKQFTVDDIGGLIEHQKYLLLPRLSSQIYFDELCPISPRSSQHLCIIMLTTDAYRDAGHIRAFQNFVRDHRSTFKAKAQFSYLYMNKQRSFVTALLSAVESEMKNQKHDFLVMWRYDHNMARFEWLSEGWSDDGNSFDETRMKTALELFSNGTAKLGRQVVLKQLVDEYLPSFFTRFSRAFVRTCETVWFHMTKEEMLPLLSVFGTFLVILLVGYGLSFANSPEGRSRQYSQGRRKANRRANMGEEDQWHPEDPHTGQEINNNRRPRTLDRQRRIMRDMEPLMHELRAETYFGMIRLLKPGCRSIVVLVDEQSKDLLLPQFAKHVWPFRNNKTFSFGYLMVEKNLPWFRKLLEHTLPAEGGAHDEGGSKSLYERLKNINPKKTLGTVLVLCGWKLYFSMYHPMHSSPNKKNFLGFDDDGENLSSDDSDMERASREEMQALRKGRHLKLEDVLNGLPNWLDRLVEGSIRRYYIPEWPDNLR